ncbi:MAG TPA: VOC family protein [Vicinamibacterales bacterium]|nr:VOC family protein [Vicinamibacterales bacterium]
MLMSACHLFRVIMPVSDIDAAQRFYSALLEQPGMRVSPGRHYFNCGGVIVALYHPASDGDRKTPRPNFEHVYFSVPDLDAAFTRAQQAGGLSTEMGDGGLPMGAIAHRPWGERSFYMHDPSGNPLCFVDSATVFGGPPAR